MQTVSVKDIFLLFLVLLWRGPQKRHILALKSGSGGDGLART